MMAKRGTLIAVVLVACTFMAPGLIAVSMATSPSSTTFTGGFIPNKLGAASTMELGFHLRRPGGRMPPPLVGMDFRLPAGVSLTTSELGLSSCAPATLENDGSEGCLSDAVMGYGKALIVAPDAAGALVEPTGVTVLMGLPVDRHTTLLFYTNGSSPVIAQDVFSSVMLEEAMPFGADLRTSVPLLAGLPGEPDASVVSMQSTIGPKGVTYYKSVGGARVAYTPKGVILPPRCPVGGFPFRATFMFADGSKESVSTTSPCPKHGVQSTPRRHVVK
jgi:hypothetical protein